MLPLGRLFARSTSWLSIFQMKIHAVLVEMGLKMIHGTRDLGDRHQIQARFTEGHLCLSPWCIQRSGVSFLEAISYCSLYFPPFLWEAWSSRVSTQTVEYVVDLLSLSDTQHRRVETIGHLYNWWNTDYHPFLGKQFLHCGDKYLFQLCWEACAIVNGMLLFLMVCLRVRLRIMKLGHFHHM